MYSVIGTCSLCGGNVMGFTGPWFGAEPPRPYCSKCGAVEARPKTVIQMEKPGKVSERDRGLDAFENIWKSYVYDRENTTMFNEVFDSMEKIFDRVFSKSDSRNDKKKE